MTIKDFMQMNIDVIKNEIITDIPSREFDSHEFIRKFSHKFEKDYVVYLSQKENEPFRIVHSQIARFLSENQAFLEIKDNGKTISTNIFGIDSQNEKWIKTSP